MISKIFNSLNFCLHNVEKTLQNPNFTVSKCDADHVAILLVIQDFCVIDSEELVPVVLHDECLQIFHLCLMGNAGVFFEINTENVDDFGGTFQSIDYLCSVCTGHF